MRRPSSAHAIALLALFVSLGGTSYAALKIGTDQLRDSAVTNRKVANDAITSAKVRNRSLLARDFRAGQLPRGPAGVAGPRGEAGPQGVPGTARAWALVRDGSPPFLVRAQAVSAVSRVATGVYCLTAPGIDPGRTILVATVDSAHSPEDGQNLAQWRSESGACPAGTFTVETFERPGAAFQASNAVSFSVAIP